MHAGFCRISTCVLVLLTLSSPPQMTKQEMDKEIESIEHSRQNEVRPSTHTARVHAVI